MLDFRSGQIKSLRETPEEPGIFETSKDDNRAGVNLGSEQEEIFA